VYVILFEKWEGKQKDSRGKGLKVNLVSTRTARLTGSAVDRQTPSSLRHVATSFVRSLMALLIRNSEGVSLNAYCIMIIELPYLKQLTVLNYALHLYSFFLTRLIK